MSLDPRLQRLAELLGPAFWLEHLEIPSAAACAEARAALDAGRAQMDDLFEQLEGALAFGEYAGTPEAAAEERNRLREEQS